MKNIIKALTPRLLAEAPATVIDVQDVEYRDVELPVFHESPAVIYNPNNVGSIITAAILHTERGWSCFKTGEMVPHSTQYIWLDVEPSRSVLENAAQARKSLHYVFIQGRHPMTAKVSMWGAFQFAYSPWTYTGEGPNPLWYLVSAVVPSEKVDFYSVIVELAKGFYSKPKSQAWCKKGIYAELCVLACVYKNTLAAINTLKYSTPFSPVGVDQDDVTHYLEAIQAVNELVRDMRIETVYLGEDRHLKECCTTAIPNFWLAKRVILNVYPYYMNTTIGLNGVIIDTNVVKPPERYADGIVAR